MPAPTLIVGAEEVAVELGATENLTAQHLARIDRAIRSAQAKVQAYLNRPLVPVEHTLTGQRPRPGWPLTDRRAWDYEQFDDKVTVVSATPTVPADGSFTVVLAVGLDGASVEPVREWVLLDAAEQVRNDPAIQLGTRRVSSVSAEGQSVTYAYGSVAEGAAGAPPNLSALHAYRRVTVFRRRTAAPAPWPYRL